MSWLELTHIEYDGIALALSPVLSLIQGDHLFTFVKNFDILGLHLVVLKNSFRHLYPNPLSFERFAFYYTGLVSILLGIPALISYSLTAIPYDASWESIDYVSFPLADLLSTHVN